MASPAEPVTTEPTGALFRALRSVDVEPNLAYEAAEENRRRAGENVVAVLGAKIDAQGGRIEAEIKAQTARIDVLQRVIWPLIVLLAVPVFGLLLQGSHYRPWLRSGPFRWACLVGVRKWADYET